MAGGATQAQLMDLAIANLELKQLKLQGTMDQGAISMQKYHTDNQGSLRDHRTEAGDGARDGTRGNNETLTPRP